MAGVCVCVSQGPSHLSLKGNFLENFLLRHRLGIQVVLSGRLHVCVSDEEFSIPCCRGSPLLSPVSLNYSAIRITHHWNQLHLRFSWIIQFTKSPLCFLFKRIYVNSWSRIKEDPMHDKQYLNNFLPKDKQNATAAKPITINWWAGQFVGHIH